MRKLVRLILLAALISVSACATDKATLCQNAQFGFTLSLAMLDKPLTEQANVYWTAYKAGAQLALETYCVK
jgi:hypothetical protein